MQLELHLLDHEEKVHDDRDLTFNDEATVDQLRDKVKSLFYIDHECQELFFNGARLRRGTLRDAGVTDGKIVVVKHALLKNWSIYLEQVDKIRKLTTSGATSRRKDMALRDRELLSPLNSSGFFVVYPDFLGKRDEIDSEINFLVYNTKKYMCRSLTTYFGSLFAGHTLKVIEKSKKADGIQLGYFVFVENAENQPTNSYYAKTIGIMPKVEFESGLEPEIDLTELFVYKLLSLIGAGAPEVHIVADTTRSEYVYLATSIIENFFTASGNSIDQMLEGAPSKVHKKQFKVDEETTRPLKILALLLGLEDLIDNKGNYGFVERQPTKEEKQDEPIYELRIVDFRVNISRRPLTSKDKNDITCTQICFNKWNLLQNIDTAKQLVENDRAIKGNENVNKDIFDFYVERIKTAVKDFNDRPRKTKPFGQS